jgi:hypothetical protein
MAKTKGMTKEGKEKLEKAGLSVDKKGRVSKKGTRGKPKRKS